MEQAVDLFTINFSYVWGVICLTYNHEHMGRQFSEIGLDNSWIDE